MEMHPQARTDNAAWEDIEPTLNQSLAALGDAGFGQNATLLRQKRHHCAGFSASSASHYAHGGGGSDELRTGYRAPHDKSSGGPCGGRRHRLACLSTLGRISQSHENRKIEDDLGQCRTAACRRRGFLRNHSWAGPDQKTDYRTVLLVGKARYVDGTSAGGVRIEAQIQDKSDKKIMASEKPGLLSDRDQQLSENMTRTRPNGTYTLAVGADLGYNVMILPNNLLQAGQDDGWVSAAAEGVTGQKDQKIVVPDLILTRGAFAVGTVTDKASGKPLDGVNIGSYGPARPSSGGGIIGGVTDDRGHYRLRLAPGKNQLYVADYRYTEGDTESGTFVTIAAGQTQTANFRVTPK